MSCKHRWGQAITALRAVGARRPYRMSHDPRNPGRIRSQQIHGRGSAGSGRPPQSPPRQFPRMAHARRDLHNRATLDLRLLRRPLESAIEPGRRYGVSFHPASAGGASVYGVSRANLSAGTGDAAAPFVRPDVNRGRYDSGMTADNRKMIWEPKLVGRPEGTSYSQSHKGARGDQSPLLRSD